jgi:N-acetylmuramoyl-L-alanine amidase
MKCPGIGLLAALASLLALGAGPAEAQAIRIEVRSGGGALLGDVLGVVEGKTAYFALTDVARLVRGTVRTSADGARATLTHRGRALELTRDSPRAVVHGRPLALAAPVRVRERSWLVPDDLVLKGVPALLGAGAQAQVVPLEVPIAAPPVPPAVPAAPAASVAPAAPVAPVAPVPPAGATAARPVVLASLPPQMPPPPVAGAPSAASAPRPGRAPAAEPALAPPAAARPAPAPPVPAATREPAPAALVLRYHTYPTHTRVVVEGVGPGDPEVRAGDREVTMILDGAAGRVSPLTRPVQDGLLASIELADVAGRPALRVRYDQVPAARRVLRLDDPPRLVVDFHRPGAPGGGPPAGAGESPRGSEAPRPPAAEPPPAVPEPPRATGPGPGPAPAARPDADVPAGDGTSSLPLRSAGIEVRYRSYPGYTRIVLEGASAVEPRLIESGGALVVPLAGLSGRMSPVTRTVRDGLIAGIELRPSESRGQPALRMTFERRPAARKVYRLQDPPRLVLDFYRAGGAPPAQAALQTIVIDPGHGGHDPGALGPGGAQEKEITLDIARRVAALCQEELGLKVVLTRTRDQFVSLRERTAFANRQKADLFLSIHVNAAPGATATGTETYFLSSEATDNAARAAAAFENKVIALEPGQRGASGRDILRSILWDLAQSEFQQESSRLAEALESSLDRALRQPSRGVKQAPFYVLGGAAMPATLVEIGFITNPHEEQRLRDDGYRDRIARALVVGLAAYKRHYDQKSGVVVSR